MTKRVQFRRGSAADNSTFVGAEGEITVDLTNRRLRLHDNVTQGGQEIPNMDDLVNGNMSHFGIGAPVAFFTDGDTYYDTSTSPANLYVQGTNGSGNPEWFPVGAPASSSSVSQVPVWADVKSARSLSTTYTNSSSTSMLLVNVWNLEGFDGGFTTTATVNGVEVAHCGTNYSAGFLSFQVPPSGTYSVTSSSGDSHVIGGWTECSIPIGGTSSGASTNGFFKSGGTHIATIVPTGSSNNFGPWNNVAVDNVNSVTFTANNL